MKLLKMFAGFTAALILLALTGCAKYRPLPLKRVKMHHSLYSSNEHIAFAYHIFTLEDCFTYLDRNVLYKGYQPINITFVNNSNKFLHLSKANFSFPCVTSLEVAQKVHTSTVKRVVGYGVAGLFIWPFLIPAIVDGIGSSDANQKLDFDFKYKALHTQTVPPYTTVNGLIFVSVENFNPDFSLTVVDSENNKRFALTTHAPSIQFERNE